MAHPFFTIGHSNRGLDEFVELLRSADVHLVADVRKVPRSRANPQYGIEALPGSLEPIGIAYEHIAALGGLRGRQPASPKQTPNTFWTNPSFRNYADYAGTPGFRAGLDRLIALGERRRCAIMCAEAVWWRCHRRIIADHLLAAGRDVFHILGPGQIHPAVLTPGARIGPDRSVIYPETAGQPAG
jgi:uncharacterized protein (DUF488 family)